jgi:AAA domain
MKRILKAVLTALFGREKELNDRVSSPAARKYKTSNIASEKAKNDQIRSDRCQRILNYWLDAELFDLPECPMDYTKQYVSEPADKFVEIWGQEAEQKFKVRKLKITKDSRLLVMFQCHRAGYIAKDDEKHPNYTIPRTYLVAQAMIPRWDKERHKIVWFRSEEKQDLIINLATVRTLYRRCRSSVPNNMSLSDWVEARMESIECMLHTGLSTDDDESPLDTKELQKRLRTINRDLADQFWPDEQARKYMLHQCQPIESNFQADKLDTDTPSTLKNGTVTFRWRFCYYPEGSESQQLGPFFVQDLERAITSVLKSGIEGLSRPLQSYLLGNSDQIEIKNAVNEGDFFWPLTNKLIYGRWPENPNHGLSLFQSIAVNVARAVDENPIVSVNGPPGTGKTTLLKDIIADKFVARTQRLKELSRSEDWLTNDNTVQAIMQYSMVVASSNNKAVENISKELPSLAKLPDVFTDITRHFRGSAPKGDWGFFCAVLGNSSNRNVFKPLLQDLREHMRNVNDYFQLNYFVNLLEKNGKNDASEVFLQFIKFLKNDKKLIPLVEDINKCQAYQKYNHFFEPLTVALIKIELDDLTAEQFSDSWRDLDEVQWELALEAIKAFKRQWFGKKLYQEHLEKKLRNAEKSFDTLFAKIKKLGDSVNSEWQFDHTHLIGSNSYLQHADESEEEANKRLHLSSPLGSAVLNQCRSELFIKALDLNEALLENVSSQFANYWEQLEQLIDGRLETKENNPEHQQLWSILFLFFPVVSTSLSSVENQFRLMQKSGVFGLAIIDEAGQAVNYHVIGLLQRSRQVIFVGDPIQLEPVVAMPTSIDLAIADEFLPISKKDGERQWGDDYLVSSSSAQSIADNAGRYMAKIGERKVGIPLLVHRRCTEPMFSIANKIAYNGKMILASQPFEWPALQSGWIHVSESPTEVVKPGYANSMEANIAFELIQFLVEEQPEMVKGGVYIITPFSLMRSELKKLWARKAKLSSNHDWMLRAFGTGKQDQNIEQFAENNIGTVHTFQGKEASTVIICTSASKVRKKEGGITWVNSTPNLLNVAITRAKHHLFVVGNIEDWSSGTLSSELQNGGMLAYEGFEQFKRQQARPFNEHCFDNKAQHASAAEISFDFG